MIKIGLQTLGSSETPCDESPLQGSSLEKPDKALAPEFDSTSVASKNLTLQEFSLEKPDESLAPESECESEVLSTQSVKNVETVSGKKKTIYITTRFQKSLSISSSTRSRRFIFFRFRAAKDIYDDSKVGYSRITQ
ncbi:hypothetical protein ACJJTC_001806 [Scirpophaga incertulas]